MSGKNRSVELQGSNPRDHQHPRQHYFHRAHRDWKFWCAVILMLAMILAYVFSDDLRFGSGGKRPGAAVPAIGGP